MVHAQASDSTQSVTLDRMTTTFTARERLALGSVAVVGALGLNGIFLYALVARPALLGEALGNPIALAFILEAFVLVGLLAYLMARWGVTRIGWGWFVVLSLLGGVAFALPVAVLWKSDGAAGAGR